ncbi:MAG: aminotransferase class I/II-fold pyridoxal phosphate-dependent enzyme, partial [Planctomycetota bacterium]|nr:aminotransferase class I/II-fold pyridoxal phosphate-dependent enzyme [Planctomycetota bacterium]
LVEIADRRDAILIVDEAHGTGVWGESGRGACEAQGIADRVPVRIGTLSKAVGSLGGFVAGDQRLIDWLWNRGRTQVYSTALPPAVCAAAAEGLRIITAEPQRRAALWRNCDLFRQKLQGVGIDPPRAAAGPIVPLVLADAELAVEIAGRLEERGFLVGGIRPPTVPQGTSRLRITLSAVHDEESLVELVEAIRAVWPRFR